MQALSLLQQQAIPGEDCAAAGGQGIREPGTNCVMRPEIAILSVHSLVPCGRIGWLLSAFERTLN